LQGGFDEAIEADSGFDGFVCLLELFRKFEAQPEIEGDLFDPVLGIEKLIIGMGVGWQVTGWNIGYALRLFQSSEVSAKDRFYVGRADTRRCTGEMVLGV
jgi:hypothetical protein